MGFSEDLLQRARAVVQDISEGSTLRKSCLKYGISLASFHSIVSERRDILEVYQRAREMRADLDVDQILDISDDETIDPQRARNMIEARKWRASKQYAKVYGDKLDISSTQTISILDVRQEALKRVLDFRGQANEIFDAETVPEAPAIEMNEQSSENDIFS